LPKIEGVSHTSEIKSTEPKCILNERVRESFGQFV